MQTNPISDVINNAATLKTDAYWDEPDLTLLDNTTQAPPTFPIDLFGDFWRTWINQSAQSKSCPPDYVGCSLLGVASSLIGNAIWPQAWDGWQEPPVLWFGLVGIPSSGKSPGLSACVNLLDTLQKETWQDFPNRKQQHTEALQIAKIHKEQWEDTVKQAVKNGHTPPIMPDDATEPQEPTLPRLSSSDSTVEALARLLTQNPKGMSVLRDELAGWLGQMDRYGGKGSDRAFWLESYGGRPYTVDRVKHLSSPIMVSHLTLGLIGGIQPDRLESALISGDDDGLASRFSFIWPVPISPTRPTIVADNHYALESLRKLHLLEMVTDEHGNMHPQLLKMEEAAAQSLDEFRARNHQEQLVQTGRYLSYLGKLNGIALRLSLVFELIWASTNNGPLVIPNEISTRAIGASITFIEAYLIPMAQRVFGNTLLPKAQRDARLIANWIYSNNIQRFNPRTDIQRKGTLYLSKTTEIKNALAELEEASWIVPLPSRDGSTNGRQKGDYLVNPRIWTANDIETDLSPHDISDKRDNSVHLSA